MKSNQIKKIENVWLLHGHVFFYHLVLNLYLLRNVNVLLTFRQVTAIYFALSKRESVIYDFIHIVGFDVNLLHVKICRLKANHTAVRKRDKLFILMVA